MFVYTGEEQTYEPVGFDSDTMNITDNATETNADTYNVKVSLKDNDNYLWTDYTYGDISFSFTIQRAEPDYVVPSLMATVGQVIGEVAMPDNFSLREDIVGTDSVGTVGSGATIYLTYTPDDPDNYLVVEDIEVTLTIVESLADVKTAKIAEIDALDDTLVEADYTVASWTAFQNAITADKTAVTAKASIAEINAYDVTARVSALVTIQSVVDDFADDNSTALALTTSTVAIADKTAINTAISAYNALAEEVKAELAAEKTLLDSLLGKIAELEAELALAEAKTDAKAELDIYVDSNDYRSAEQATLATAIADGKTAIDNSADTSAVSVALANAKTAINAIKTDAEYQVEEVATALAEAKTDAKAELDLYADSNDYRSAEQATLATAIADGKTAIDNSADIVLLDIALANAKTEIDEIKTDAEYQVEEVATATALANAKTAKIAEINALMATFSQSDYRAEEWAEIEDTFASAIASVNASSSLLSLGTAVDLVSLQSSVEEVLTDSEKTAEENNPAPPEVEEGDDPASTDDENGLALGLGLGLGLPLALGVVMLLLLFLNKFGVLGLGFVDKQKWLKFFHNSKK